MPSTGNHIILTDQRPPVIGDPSSVFSSFNRSPIDPPQNPRFDVHPNLCPSDLFAVKVNRCTVPGHRFIRKNDDGQMLMFVDGACAGNGTPNASAGWAVCLGPQIIATGRLESEGGPQTNNRAELRAAIVALGLRFWPGEGFSSIVLAGDSEYVVKGYCEYLPKWKQGGWKTSAGLDVMNRDLWEALDARILSLARDGAQVFFWQIPREWNEADKYAQEATTPPPTEGSPTATIMMLPYVHMGNFRSLRVVVP